MALQDILDFATQGVPLPAAGGTPGTLNVYEQNYAHNTTWSGPWAARTANCLITLIGNMVFMHVSTTSATTTATAPISMDTVLPVRFRPLAESRVILNATNVNLTNVQCVVSTAGNITVYGGGAQISFGTGITATLPSSTLIWTI